MTASTNADLLADAQAGATEGRWLRAIRQTGGRGRMGRNWQSPEGNLHASTLIRLFPGDPSPATLALVAIVALHETACTYAPDAGFSIKWPNDLMAGAAKVAGILLERVEDAVVIGFGVNLAACPEGLDRPVASIASLVGHAPDAAEFLCDLAESFARWVSLWRTHGLIRIIPAWEKAAHAPGAALSATLPGGERLEGLFVGIDSHGALRLRLADGHIRAIHAADVFIV